MRMCAVYEHYVRDLIGNTCARFYSQICTSRRALKPFKTRKTGCCAHEKEREILIGSRNTLAKAGKINEAERNRARHSTQTADA